MKKYLLILALCVGCASEHQENQSAQSLVEQEELPDVNAEIEDTSTEAFDTQDLNANQNKYNQLANEDISFPDQVLSSHAVLSKLENSHSQKQTEKKVVAVVAKIENPPLVREPAQAIKAEDKSLFTYLKSPLILMTSIILFLHYILSRYNNKKAAVIRKAMSDLKSLE